MCARFYRLKDLKELYRRFKIQEIPSLLDPQYNIAPTETAMVIPAVDGARKAVPMKFGMVNPWVVGTGPLLNMRAESFVNKPAFKEYLGRRRCLVPADGFFEWRKTGAGSTPFRFGLKSEETMGLAGVWDQNAFAIITVEANALAAAVHHLICTNGVKGKRQKAICCRTYAPPIGRPAGRENSLKKKLILG